MQADCLRPKNKEKSEVNAFPKLIGGTPSSRGRFPYMCSLRRRGDREHVCGGTLIKSQWVLTAAHCVDPDVDGSTGLSVLIYCGIYERDERNSSKVFAADVTFIHPEWKGDLLEGQDIALIKLDKPYHSLLPDLEARSNVHRSGTVFAALGWGQNSSGSFSDLLQIAAGLVFVAKNICNQDNYWGGQIKDSMICAGTGEQDTQQGDSGGPLLQLDLPNGDYTLGEPSYDLLVAITSFGGGSESGFVPSVYTSISYVRDWIDCIIEDKENCSNDSQGATESSVNAKESKTITNNATRIEQDSQPSPSSKASSASDILAEEHSLAVPESFADGSEEATQEFEALLDLCPDIQPQQAFNDTVELERARTAIKEDDYETVEEILCKGLSPNTEFSVSSYKSNWTLLHEAAMYDAIKSVLIDYGADMEKQNSRSYLPLRIAARYNSFRIAKLLIKSGADINSSVDDGWQPLHVAASYDSEDVAELLIKSGANVESKTVFGLTPLHLAAKENSSAVAKLLLSRGADAESRDDWNHTSLHHAADDGALEVAKLLVDAGANIKSTNIYKSTPLHEAAWKGHLQIAKILVDHGADVNAKNEAGQTPLHQAARANKFDVAKFLIKKGASKKKKNNYKDTPFDIICAYSLCNSIDAARFKRLLKV